MNKSHIDALAAAITAAIVAYAATFDNAPAAADDTDTADSDTTVDVTGQLDSAGFPWDERIHSSKKTQKSDGTWTARKGAAALIPGVEAELRAAGYGGGAAPVAAPVAPVTTAPVAPVTTAPVMPSFTITPPAPVAATEYAKLCKLIADNSDKLNQEWVTKLFTDNGFPGGLASLAGNEEASKAFADGIATVLPQ